MKFTTALPFIFTTLGLAAPTAREQRQVTTQVTLYMKVEYGGSNTRRTVALDTDNSLSIELPPSESWLDAQGCYRQGGPPGAEHPGGRVWYIAPLSISIRR
jgi:hypothetical protein